MKTILGNKTYTTWLGNYMNQAKWTTLEDLDKACEEAFRPHFTKTDLQLLKNRKRTRWQLGLDWAKSSFTGRQLILNRSKKGFPGRGIIVLNDETKLDEEGREHLTWVLAAPSRENQFRKKCPTCSRWWELNQQRCRCGHRFTIITKKTVLLKGQ